MTSIVTRYHQGELSVTVTIIQSVTSATMNTEQTVYNSTPPWFTTTIKPAFPDGSLLVWKKWNVL